MNEHIISERGAWMNLLVKIKQQQVILTASICIIALAIVLKNILFIPTDILIRDMMIYIIVYLGFLMFAFKIDDKYEKSAKISTLIWDILIVFITLAIITVYAL
ncbi:MAG: hypothetical protein NT022_13270 [Deltaproteobacteria bacterium]|nr:hypothetical protein [Deltaproteobacteria bacterium]